ncbi:MAG TPA: multicopper oxidase domain-containing protein [Phycisphaerae bacterium]|jgi:hypothetical protein|nr:multicopper oxidase domain-containing protein [Phycisphaerae bacterium]
MALSRREFLARGLGGSAALVVGSAAQKMPFLPHYASLSVQTLNFHISDAIKDMVTHNAINEAQCYFWVFKEERWPAEVPGPIILTTYRETIEITITNDLDEPHAFYIPGMFNSGPIQPGETYKGSFQASKAGTFLYYDNLNEPVNRMMGLHGAFIVMPAAPQPGHKYTPYVVPTAAVQRLFDDFGSAPWWPGLAWEEGDHDTHTLAFRQYVWLLHQASPNLFAEVGELPPGEIYPGDQFMEAFLRDPFSPTGDNRIPQYFTINGQSGHFAHNSPHLCPNNRVGEPVIIRVLNAGLWTHSIHIHGNHVYLLALNGAVQKNALWVDTFTARPMDTFDWAVPFMRPPDIPNERGIGRADPGLPTTGGGTTWPPNEELALFIPAIGDRMGLDLAGEPIDLSVQLSPLCYPMHDHSEPTQTSQGGNYNCGLVSGIDFTGDRNTPSGVTTFPIGSEHEGHGPEATGPAAPPIGEYPQGTAKW